jgi:hypothetical protein
MKNLFILSKTDWLGFLFIDQSYLNIDRNKLGLASCVLHLISYLRIKTLQDEKRNTITIDSSGSI